MSYELGENPSSWLDAALREVPLPPDLIARLRRLGVDDDRALDRVLRSVTVPQGLVPRFKQIPNDVQLDQHLIDVGVPPSLARCLKEIPSTTAHFAAEVRPKQPNIASLSPPPQRASRSVVRRVTTCLIAASFSFVVAVGAWRLVLDRPDVVDGTPIGGPSPAITILAPDLFEAPGLAGADPLGSLAMSPPAGGARSPAALGEQFERSPSDLLAADASVLAEAQSNRGALWSDASLSTLSQFAMPEQLGASRPLSYVDRARGLGWVPPAVDGFDWVSLLREGIHPFVSPADHPRLSQVRLPLTTGTRSYDEFRILLEQRELIAPQDIRTEEFLSAVDYDFPQPQEGTLAMYAAGGPSPWDPLERKFLLVGVHAQRSAAVPRAPVELTIVVDASIALPGADAFAVCREALGMLVDAVQAGDRVSIMLAGQRPVLVARDLGGDDTQELIAAIGQIGPQPLVDIVPTLEAALSSAGRGGSPARGLVVCLTSDFNYVAPAERKRLVGLVAEASQRGVRFEAIRLAAWDRPEDTLAQLAAAGAGDVHAASSPNDLWSILYRLLTTQVSIAAENVELTVKFDPQMVEGYRIVGHESFGLRSWEGMNPGGTAFVLGQTSVALLELKLRANAGNSIGAARLSWQDPATGRAEETVQQLGAAQFVQTLAEAPLPLQRATIAAMTAEVLRKARYVPAGMGLEQVLQMADTLDGRLWEERWFVELIRALDAAILLRRH